MPEFAPSEAKMAVAPITVMPSGLSCEAEVFLGPDEATKVVTSGLVPFTSAGVSQDIHLPVTMPSAEGSYHCFIDVYAEGILIAAYQAIEDVTITAEAGWVSPTGHNDPSGEWINVSNAYDGDPGTAAIGPRVGYCMSTDWLEFTHAAISCDQVMLNVFTYANYDEWFVDVYYDGAWHNVLQSKEVPSKEPYVIYLGGIHTVTAMRVKHHGWRDGYVRPSNLYEVAFYQLY